MKISRPALYNVLNGTAAVTIMRSSSGSEPVGEADEVAFVDGIEHHDGRALDDLVL
jgi:hypothetical protein